MNLFPDAGYIDDYDIGQFGQRIKAWCTHCEWHQWLTLRPVKEKKDIAINRQLANKLDRMAQKHVDREHYPTRWTPKTTPQAETGKSDSGIPPF
jgi:hypothetical protein